MNRFGRYIFVLRQPAQKKQPQPKNDMKRIAAILALIMALTVCARADEIFVATHNTGTQTVGSAVDITYDPWGPPTGFPGDPGASLSGIASNWNLVWANWYSGNGYATIDIDTNHATGTYNVGTVNATGQTIWVILQ
jgi:hypothetical protein